MQVQPHRLVIVRRGEATLFKSLQEQFSDDPETRILWDRRMADRRVPGERRFPESGDPLRERGFFVTRAMWTPGSST
jgi:hypothetical protein